MLHAIEGERRSPSGVQEEVKIEKAKGNSFSRLESNEGCLFEGISQIGNGETHSIRITEKKRGNIPF